MHIKLLEDWDKATNLLSSPKTLYMGLLLKLDTMQKLNRVKSMLENDCSLHYTLSMLCQIIGTNEYLLKNGFKQIFKMTVYEYLTHLRIEKAKQMLASTDYSIRHIANNVGFSDSPAFIKMFKKKTGYSPLAWRKLKKSVYLNSFRGDKYIDKKENKSVILDTYNNPRSW